MRKIDLLAFRDVAKRRFQFGALGVIIGLGIAIYVCLVVAFTNIGNSYDRVYATTNFADYFVKLQQAPESASSEVAAIPGVAAAEGRLVFDTGLSPDGGSLVQARMIGVPTDRRPAVNDVIVTSGRYFNPGEAGGVLVLEDYLNYYRLKEGDKLTFQTPNGPQELTIVGAVASPEYLLLAPSAQDFLATPKRFGVFFVSEDQLGRMFNAPGEINEVNFTVNKDANGQEVADAVTSTLQQYGVLQSIAAKDQPSKMFTQLDLDGAHQLAVLLPLLVLIVGGFAAWIALTRLVQSQRMLIGIFKANGYGTRSILWHYLLIASLIAVGGGIFGLVVGYPLSLLLTDAYASSLKLPLVSYQIQFVPAGIGLGAALLVCLLAAALPALTAARTLPAAAMRPSPPMVSPGPLMALVGRMRLWGPKPPMAARLLLRNIWRSPSRAGYTVAAIALGLVLLVASLSLLDSLSFSLNRQFDRIDLWDVFAFTSEGSGNDLVSQVTAVPGVASVDPLYQQAGQASAKGRNENVLVVALDPQQTLHGFQLKGGGTAGTALDTDKGVILVSSVAKSLNVGLGDEVTLTSGASDATLPVTGLSQEPLGSAAYVSTATGAAIGLSSGYNEVLVRVQGRPADEVAQDISRISGVLSVQLKSDIRSEIVSLMALFQVMVGVIVLFGIIMFLAIVFNTLMTNVLEREHETATMRTLGTRSRSIVSLLEGEGLFLSVAAIVPGLFLGVLAGVYLLSTYSTPAFDLGFHIKGTSVLAVALLALGAAAVASVPAIVHAMRLNLATATRSVE